MSKQLLATLPLLDGKSRDELKAIALSCEITVEWLYLLTKGQIKEPGASKLERLYEHLTGNVINY